MMNIEIILINNQMTQNKIKDLLNNKIKKSKKKKLEYSVIIFSNVPSLQIDQILKLLKENTTLCLKAIVTKCCRKAPSFSCGDIRRLF